MEEGESRGRQSSYGELTEVQAGGGGSRAGPVEGRGDHTQHLSDRTGIAQGVWSRQGPRSYGGPTEGLPGE